MKKKLKSLEQHNSESWTTTSSFNDPVLNGIACPDCGGELYDSNPMVTLTSTLTSYPAQKSTHCSKCDYTGYRIA